MEAEFQKLADQYGMDLEMVKKYLQADQVKDQVTTQKAVAVVVDSAVATKPEKKDEGEEKKPARKSAKKAEDGEEKKPARKSTKKAEETDGEEKKPARKSTKKAAEKKEDEEPAESN